VSDTRTDEPIRITKPVSIARLHGRARWYCGAVARDLAPAGYVRCTGSVRVRPIMICGCERGAT
jgi:hypothetical protein